MGFTKLDSDILLSSLMMESAEVFKVFVAILAACKSDGIAPVSAPVLSGTCFMPIEKVMAAIEVLESPDKHSRSMAEDGRRIKRIDGGYIVVNYHKYRERWNYSENPESVRKREYRAKKAKLSEEKGQGGTMSQSVRDIYASASASASGGKGGMGERGKPKKAGKHLFKNSPFYDFDAFVAATKWPVDKARHYYQSAEEYSEAKNAMYANWVMAVRNWARRDEAEERGYYSRKRKEQRLRERRSSERRPPAPKAPAPTPEERMTDEELAEFRRSFKLATGKIGEVPL